jgi:hypothetical protein
LLSASLQLISSLTRTWFHATSVPAMQGEKGRHKIRVGALK